MITVENGKLHLEDVFIEDEDIVHFFSTISIEDEDDLYSAYFRSLIRALKIGVFAIQRSETQIDIDYIRQEFGVLHRQMGQTLDAIFNKDNGKLALALSDYLGEDGKLLYFLKDEITGEKSKFSQMLDVSEEKSPLRKLHEALDRRFTIIDQQIIAVQKQIAGEKGAKEEAEMGTRQGFDFEDCIEDILIRLSKPYKDVINRVGTQSEGGSKKGDFIIEIKQDGKTARILVEAKRDSGKGVGGKNGILADIDQAKENRLADFAIAVYSEEACPKEVGALRYYNNNRVICSIPADCITYLPLEVAYMLARTEVCWQMQHVSGGIDRARVKQAMDQIQEKLRIFQGIKAKAASLRETAKTLRDDLDDLERSIKESVKIVLQELDDDEEEETT